MLGALIHCWVHLAGVSAGEKTYSGSSIIIKIYLVFSLAIGGRGTLDGVLNLIIKHVINRASQGASLLLGAFGGVFWRGKIVFSAYYNYKDLSRPFPGH